MRANRRNQGQFPKSNAIARFSARFVPALQGLAVDSAVKKGEKTNRLAPGVWSSTSRDGNQT
eukprot:878240-Rhodomonas_salina.1